MGFRAAFLIFLDTKKDFTRLCFYVFFGPVEVRDGASRGMDRIQASEMGFKAAFC